MPMEKTTSKTVEGITYKVTSIPTRLAPFNDWLCDLLQKTPSSFDEAKRNGEERVLALQTLIEGCVDPKPPKEHWWLFWYEINKLHKQVLIDAGLFREPKSPNVDSGDSAGPAASQETKRDIKSSG